ncbi:MAG: glycyl-radical enzyme activating protein [Coriobacteriales bacterium]|jgi:pyruvate formate lyase activating enzyme|nr:glycyl-radical enzyme activating protein [Coriobacteriales bacterium]
MAEQTSLRVFDEQSFSVNDGPGIRRTVFLQGCPLKCLWCHSPESQSFESRILWLGPKCVGCLKCVAACPTGARSSIAPKEEYGRVKIVCDWEKCTDCGLCEQACPTKALYRGGVDKTFDEVMFGVIQDQPFYRKSGGGLTVSGGEALCQADGVAELLRRCKDEDIHTAVDTCGFIPYTAIQKVMPWTDIYLYDLKHMDSERHREATGVPNELILENARKLAEDGGRLHIRIPLIPNINADTANIEATRDFLLEIKDAVEVIQVLPYHNLGNAKWDRLSLEPPELDTFVPSDEAVAEVVKIFEDAGFEVMVH